MIKGGGGKEAGLVIRVSLRYFELKKSNQIRDGDNHVWYSKSSERSQRRAV